MSQIPFYSTGDAIAPYRAYNAVARMMVTAGGTIMPLAYKAVGIGQPARPTGRLLQLTEPRAVFSVIWRGVRELLKPQCPKILKPGSFILQSAGAQVDGVSRDASGNDVYTASGSLVFYTATQPSEAEVPALWFPWDGRYNTTAEQVAQVVYTPEELGFGQWLPGEQQPTSLKGITNNPPAQSNNNVMFI